MGELALGRPRILVTGKVYPVAIDLLGGGATVDYHPEGLGGASLGDLARDCQGILCTLVDRVPAEVFENSAHLRGVTTVSVGFDHIDVAAAKAAGVQVTYTPGVLTEATADQAFALLLGVARKVVVGDRFVRDGSWKSWSIDLLCGAELHGQTLGIVGFGRIGQAVARRARGFGMEVLYAARTRRPADVEESLGARHVSLEELLSSSRFVSLHVPGTSETRGMIGAGQLERMRRDAFLINTARGNVVDETALVDALEWGWIAGAGLDVFEAEPKVHPGLLGREDVVLAPHLGSATVETRQAMCRIAAEDLLAVLAGRKPRHPVPGL